MSFDSPHGTRNSLRCEVSVDQWIAKRLDWVSLGSAMSATGLVAPGTTRCEGRRAATSVWGSLGDLSRFFHRTLGFNWLPAQRDSPPPMETY